MKQQSRERALPRIRISTEERALIERAAASEDRPMSAFIRTAAVRAAQIALTKDC